MNKRVRTTPSYKGLTPASSAASRVHSRSSIKANTRCELLLRSALWRRGLRYRLNAYGLPGRPDVVFRKERIVVFVDGDFWHGRDWSIRRQKLEAGTNPKYWVQKIESNIARDRRIDDQLRTLGWTVIRLWESDISADIARHSDRIEKLVRKRRAY